MLDGLQLLGGLVILMFAAEAFIRGAVRVARSYGVSPFVIGLTLVGFGTSAPELIVNLSAALQGAPGLAVGNVVGSNIANVGLILGLAAIVKPLAGQMRLLKVELPVLIAASVLFLSISYDLQLDRWEGILLLSIFVMLLAVMVKTAHRESPDVKKEIGQLTAESGTRPALAAAMVLIGLGGLVVGAELMVSAAVSLARDFGVPDHVIGLTIVAVGTSLPELASTVAAARRGEADIALGNVIGSNIFNLLLIMGVTVTICPIAIADSGIVADIAVMLVFSLALLPILFSGLRVHRYEGIALFLSYIAFLGWQISHAK